MGTRHHVVNHGVAGDSSRPGPTPIGWNQPGARGFTFIEISIVVVIIATLVGISGPVFFRFIKSAKETGAAEELRQIELEISAHIGRTGFPPASLAEIGMDQLLDPWGRPYEYLRLVDAPDSDDGGNGNGGNGNGGNGNGGNGNGGNGGGGNNGNGGNGGGNGNGGGVGQARKDHFLVPLNSDYDLYSKGPDGKSSPPLTAEASRDDIIRANDGAYFGLASDY
ncbi:MAG: prepilin-type N-terminal cleavage/methylation domain-containing protein [Planctomycetota bacterium]